MINQNDRPSRLSFFLRKEGMLMNANPGYPPPSGPGSRQELPHTDYGDCFSPTDVQRGRNYQVKKAYISPPSGRRRAVGKFFKVLFSLLLIVVLLFCGYVALVVFRIHYSDEQPDHDAVARSVGELKSDGSVENIMIYGADNHQEGEYGRSDSMILLSVDKKNHTVKQTSFLRDLYVTIPGHDDNRLNAAFAYGGAKLATETIEYNFGIRIDSYVVIDFSGFTQIIDAMGGMTLSLTAEEIDYINWQCWRNKQVDTRNELVIDESTFFEDENEQRVAKVHLNGRQALWYARDRDSAGSDFDRTTRQRIVIDTMLSQLKSSDPFTLMAVAFQAAPLLTTNMSKTDVVGKMFSLIGILGYEKQEYSVPRRDNFVNLWVDGAAVLGLEDADYEKQKLYEFLYGTA